MSKKQETVSPVIPKNYCMINIMSKISEEENCNFMTIKGIAIYKIREIGFIEKYIVEMPQKEQPLVFKNNKKVLAKNTPIKNILPKICDIIGKDNIIILNSKQEMEYIKIICETLDLNIDNNIIYGRKIFKDIDIQTSMFLYHYFELLA